MGRLADEVIQLREARNLAKGDLDRNLAQVREDVEARGLGARALDSITDQTRDILDEARDIADQNHLVIAGTIAALALWFFRKPIMAGLAHLLKALASLDDEKD